MMVDDNTVNAKAIKSKMAQLHSYLSLSLEELNSAIIVHKRKLSLCQERLKVLEEEKMVQELEQRINDMRDKLIICEDQLESMEFKKRELVLNTNQTQMDLLNLQLQRLNDELQKVHPAGINLKILGQKNSLEAQIKHLLNTNTLSSLPVMDTDTNALRDHIIRLQENIIRASKELEEKKKTISTTKTEEYLSKIK